MEEVKVSVTAILDIVRVNRGNHRAEFERACDGFLVKAQQELERHLSDIKAGHKIAIRINLPEPEDHTKDYDRVIKMLEMSVDENVIIQSDDFANFVMDDWQWKPAWTASNTAYMAASRK